jgi:hypothetical protein
VHIALKTGDENLRYSLAQLFSEVLRAKATSAPRADGFQGLIPDGAPRRKRG